MSGVEVEDGMKGGVGERIAGRGDGETIGVVISTGIFPPVHAPSQSNSIAARTILFIP
jgi:hypothetical protein